MNDTGSFSWPDFHDKHRISEDALAQAYAALSDIERSWIKKNIAQLFALFPPNAKEQANSAIRWTTGLQTVIRTRPKDWVILLLSGSLSGPARAISAVLPAMTSGVRNILAVFQGQTNPPAPLLAGLEMCGVESVCSLNPRKTKELFNSLAHFPAKGVVLDLEGSLPALRLSDSSGAMAIWRPAPLHSIGIWSETAHQWDLRTLAWSHPDLAFDVWGKTPKKLPVGFKTISGDWKAFCNHAYRARGIPALLLRNAPASCCDLILTPGQEGCWHWPDLHPEIFLFRQMILETPEAQPEESS